MERDLNLVRRRAWLFIPFLLLGVLVSFGLGRVAGQANAVASMQLETVVHEVFVGGDRGLRIFEAEAMTSDDAFKKEVITAIGDPNFDYARFSISLNPISVADGVARGVLTVSVKDSTKANAEKYRQAWVDVFTKEYTSPDGMFRQRFIDKRIAVAQAFETGYQASFADLKKIAQARGVTLPLDQIAAGIRTGGFIDELGKQEAQLVGQRAAAQAALTAAKGASPEVAAAIASSTLGISVPAGQAVDALNARAASLDAAVAEIHKQHAAFADSSLDPEVLAAVDKVRAFDQLKLEAYGRLANAQGAVVSAESTIDTSYSFSGGVAGTPLGRVAVILAVTIVFGLIAIYAIEWLSQVRAGSAD